MKKFHKIKILEFDAYVLVEEFILEIEIMLRWINKTIQIIPCIAFELPDYSRNLKK